MKTLSTIQTLSKIAKIISKIILICSIVGLCLCVVGLCGLVLGTEAIKLGGVTVEGLIRDNANLSQGTLYAGVIEGAICCVGAIIVSKAAVNYFKKELDDGTPFTLDGAKQVTRLGVLSICVPVGEQVVYAIAKAVLARAFEDSALPGLEIGSSVAIGVSLIIFGLIFKYGAEAVNDPAPENE